MIVRVSWISYIVRTKTASINVLYDVHSGRFVTQLTKPPDFNCCQLLAGKKRVTSLVKLLEDSITGRMVRG